MATEEFATIQRLTQDAISRLSFKPHEDQCRLLEALAEYAVSRGPADVFILNGYAGTGKTSLMGAMIGALNTAGIKTVTLAPTGRAAKVASGLSGAKASTIHKRIFRPATQSPDSPYILTPNTQPDTIFIVDEASLVTDRRGGESLLVQLLRHIYASPGCGLIMMGDTAQLPPIGQPDSPAMNPDRYISLGYNARYFSLDKPARQAADSGILVNATLIRRQIERMLKDPERDYPAPVLRVRDFEDVEVIDTGMLADSLSDSWGEVGAEQTLLVTRSNYRANNYNQAVRNLVMMADEPLQRGDRLVISKNDYYWSQENKLKTFIANGDMAVVEWVGRNEKMYGRYFCDVELYFPQNDIRIGAKIMLRSLMAEGPSLSREEMDRFYTHVMSEQEGAVSERMKAVMKDPYYNALQVKYGYCVTCHKAQGGQWRHVYIDMSGIAEEAMTVDFYRWLYTAITRSTEKVYFVNPSLRSDNTY